MPHDPDFHETAAAWLDGTGDDGAPRVLREILRDAPDTAVEFAALARVEAALQLAAFTPAARLQRARRMIEPSPAMRLRRFMARPAFRMAAAAVVLLAGAVWWFASRSAGPADDPGKSRLAPQRPAVTSPGIVRSSLPPEKLPPADKDFSRRMGRFIVPEFKATGVPLADALDTLRKNVAAIDDTAVPDFSAAPELPDDLTVHLHLNYQPVVILLDLIAIQSGIKFQATGRGYLLSTDPDAVPGDHIMIFAPSRESVLCLLPNRGKAAASGPNTPAPYLPGVPAESDAKLLSDAVTAALGEKPSQVLSGTNEIHFHSSARTGEMLKRLLSGPGQGYPPGTWQWNLKIIGLSTPEALARVTSLGRSHFTDEEFQTLMRELSETTGVDLMASPTVVTQAGAIGEADLSTAPDPANHPDSWTGYRVSVTNKHAGDLGGQAECSIEHGKFVEAYITPADPYGTSISNSDTTGLKFQSGETQLMVISTPPNAPAVAVFLTGNRDPVSDDLPYGIPVAGKIGFVYSPYAPEKGMVDVEGLKLGTRISCPYTNKHFRVP